MRPRTRPPRPRRSPLRPLLVGRDRRVVRGPVSHGHALDRLGQEHVLRVSQVVARVLRDLELLLQRNRVERAGELAVPAEDAAREVDLVDARVALTGRDAVVGGVLLRDDPDAVGRAGGRAERAAYALLEAVLVAPEPVPPAK